MPRMSIGPGSRRVAGGLVGLALVAASLLVMAPPSQAASYTASIPLAPTDYTQHMAVNPAGTIVYAAGLQSVAVISTATNTQVGEIAWPPGQPGDYGLGQIAMDPSGSTLWIANRIELCEASTATDQVTRCFPLDGYDLYFMKLNPAGTIAYMSGFENETSVMVAVNLSDGQVIATVPVGAQTGPIALVSGGSQLAVDVYTNSGATEIDILNAKSLAVERTIQLPADAIVPSIAANPSGSTLYVASENHGLLVMNVATGTTEADITSVDAWNVAVNPAGSQIVTDPYTDASNASVIDVNAGVYTVHTLPIPDVTGGFSAPQDIVITPNGQAAYIANGNSSVSAIALIQSTTMIAAPAVITRTGLTNSARFSARLIAGGTGLANQTVVFTIGRARMCSAITNSDGTATCTARLTVLQRLVGGTYAATFAGSTGYTGSSATAKY